MVENDEYEELTNIVKEAAMQYQQQPKTPSNWKISGTGKITISYNGHGFESDIFDYTSKLCETMMLCICEL